MIFAVNRQIVRAWLVLVLVATGIWTGQASAEDAVSLFPVRSSEAEAIRYGYVDAEGQVVIDFRFVSAGRFSEGLAVVAPPSDGGPADRRFGVINMAGQWVVEPEYLRIGEFEDGIAWAMLAGAERPQFVVLRRTQTGIQASEPIDGRPLSCSDGRIICAQRQPQGDRMVAVDRQGETVVATGDHGVQRIWPYSDGLARANTRDEQGRWASGYIDLSGRWVIQPQFPMAESFHEGLAAVVVDSGSIEHDEAGISVTDAGWGYIRRDGSVAIPGPFDEAGVFSEGFAAVEPMTGPDLYGYIDHDGRQRIAPRFIEAEPFREGLAAVVVQRHGKQLWAFVDHGGSWVIDPRFDEVESFDGGLARVETDNRSGLINREGRWIWIDGRGNVGG